MSSTMTIHHTVLSAVVMATLLLSATFGAPLPSPDGHSETRSRRSENPTLCYRKTDQQLRQQLAIANDASKITKEIIVVPFRVGDATIKVGAMRETFEILSKQSCSPCVDSTLDYDSDRFPQYLLVTRVVETDHCRSLFLNNDSHSVTVLKREGGECSSDGEEIWEDTQVTLLQIDYQSTTGIDSC